MNSEAGLRLVLISGLSGSGKSIAIRALEDAGYNCVDNLPVALLAETVHLLRDGGYTRLAVAVDARGGTTLASLPAFLASLRDEGVKVTVIFLDARDQILVRRFAETRRRHPLARDDRTIEECLNEERTLLAPVAEIGHHIDTSDLKPARLREWINELMQARSGLNTLVVESFGYKAGVPMDADLVIDARCLPNPFYEANLRPLTGRDAPVREYLDAQPNAIRLLEDTHTFLTRWLPEYARDGRGYFTVAVGCTGGQHRSVYLAEKLASRFRSTMNVIVRHREITGQ